jgi:hypothetical protein
MELNRYLFIFISIYIISLYYSKYYIGYRYLQKHTYWNNQSVSRNGIIKKNIITNEILPNNYILSTFNIDNEFYNFILNNYVKDEVYTLKHLQWVLSKPTYNISITDNNNIIGTIIGKPIKIFIYDTIKTCMYVDFLCIHKEYRNLRLAPILINQIIKTTIKNGFEFNIFKIDSKPMPFDFIGKYNYYYYDLTKYQNLNKLNYTIIYEVNIDNLNKIFNYYTESVIKKYKLYEIYNLNKFQDRFINSDIVESFYFEENKTIIGFAAIIKTQYKIDNQYVNTIELQYILTDQQYIIQIIQLLLNKYSKLGYLHFITLDIMNNNKFIKYFKFKPSYTTFYQVQNYHNETIAKENNGLNFF